MKLDVHTPDMYRQQKKLIHGGFAVDVVECWLACIVQHLCKQAFCFVHQHNIVYRIGSYT